MEDHLEVERPLRPLSYPALAAQVRRSSAVFLYEGLPHEAWEAKVRENELATKRTVTIGGEPFYAETLALNDFDSSALKRLYCNSNSFIPFVAIGKCGGYHPDYCLEWKTGTDSVFVQFCFGCSEMKTFAAGQKLHYYIDTPEFGSLLKKYRKNRPPNSKTAH
jgi:hypothetical protein